VPLVSPVPATSPLPVGNVAGPWTLAFDSEFNGTSLDTSQWSTGAWGAAGITAGEGTLEQECYDPAQVSVTNGALDLAAIANPETCGGVTQPYASGSVTTLGHFDFTYGYMEARIWLPGSGSSIADWPAFWTSSYDWPTTGEIDVLEGIGGQACAHFHNAAGGPGTCITGAYPGGWHTFAADWEPGSVTYYYDGTEVWNDTSGITSAPMYLVLNLALSTAITSPDTAPATMQVDYVRVWQH
jgi:beta-glucanase (GH16 family)